MSQKQDFIKYIDKEITSGRYEGTMESRLSKVPFPPKFVKGDKTSKKWWDSAMSHCRIWCKRIDEFNEGKKIKRVFKVTK